MSKRYTKIGKKFHLFDDNEEECIFEGDDKFQFASLSLSLSLSYLKPRELNLPSIEYLVEKKREKKRGSSRVLDRFEA